MAHALVRTPTVHPDPGTSFPPTRLREGRRTTSVTTDLAFAEWVTVFADDEKLTTAWLNRLAHHATVITTQSMSYRMRKRRGTE